MSEDIDTDDWRPKLPDETVEFQERPDSKNPSEDSFQVANHESETTDVVSDDSKVKPHQIATLDAANLELAAVDLTAENLWSNVSSSGVSFFDGSLVGSSGDAAKYSSEMPRPDPRLVQETHLLSAEPTPGFVLLEMPILGGMGCVYKAWNIQLERVVALKLSKKDKSTGSSSTAAQDFDAQLRNEAALLARIEHPSIASCYGCGRFGQYSYFEMQWIDGITLDKLIKFVHQNGLQAGFGQSQLIPWMTAMVEGLIFSQLRGVHHLDLKPQNIMLTPTSPEKTGIPFAVERDGRSGQVPSVELFQKWCQGQSIKILDFGLAKRTSQSTVGTTLSGTPGYMAPEQILGDRWLPILVDMYCVGGILYACLTGKSPNQPSSKVVRHAFQTKDLSIYCQRANAIEINPVACKDLEAIAIKCLANRPEDRYRSMDDLRGDLLAINAHLPLLARPFSLTERMAKYVKRHPYMVTIIAMLTVGLGIMGLLSSWLLQAYNETELARKSDQQTFQQAIEAVATMDQKFLTDPQLNQPENRQLAIRFKATLFQLYQLFTTRQHLELEDRRRLAEISSRLAEDQLERGDYSLAVDFYQVTLEQYDRLVDDPKALGVDRKSQLLTRIDLYNAKFRLKNAESPAQVLLEEAMDICRLADEIADTELRLIAWTSYCSLNLGLFDREGAKKVHQELELAYRLAESYKPESSERKQVKAASLHQMGLVGYKGGWERFPTCFKKSLQIFDELLAVENQFDWKLTRGYAALITDKGMTMVNNLRAIALKTERLQADSPDYKQIYSDYQSLRSEIEADYLRALKLVNQALEVDPLNSLVLRSRISCYWNLADFYWMSALPSEEADFESQEKYRKLCIEDTKQIVKQQPRYEYAYQVRTLQYVRLAYTHFLNGDTNSMKQSLDNILQTNNWEQMSRFENLDTIFFVFALCEVVSEDGLGMLCTAPQYSALLDRIIGKTEALNRHAGSRAAVLKLPEADPEALRRLGPEFSACHEKFLHLRSLLDLPENVNLGAVLDSANQ